jgi:hypothetical protein
MDKHEVTVNRSRGDSRAQHEGAAVAQMRAAIRALESACDDAAHGGYERAAEVARAARDRLYVVDIELRKAGVAALAGAR